MRILITGATSKIGLDLLDRLLLEPCFSEITLLTRSPQSAALEKLRSSTQRVKIISADLRDPLLESHLLAEPSYDICLHMAGLTHTKVEADYFQMNLHGTVRLAQILQKKNCRRFCLISSQTAGENAGAYALSKFQAEKELLQMNWPELIILRPSEIVGAGSKEGLDRFFSLAQHYKIYPWLIRSFLNEKPIVFSPLPVQVLNRKILSILKAPLTEKPPVIQILRGPEVTAGKLAWQLFRKCGALPLPIYLPLLGFVLKIFAWIGIQLIPPDQLPRLLGERMQKPVPSIQIEDCVLDAI